MSTLKNECDRLKNDILNLESSFHPVLGRVFDYDDVRSSLDWEDYVETDYLSWVYELDGSLSQHFSSYGDLQESLDEIYLKHNDPVAWDQTVHDMGCDYSEAQEQGIEDEWDNSHSELKWEYVAQDIQRDINNDDLKILPVFKGLTLIIDNTGESQ